MVSFAAFVVMQTDQRFGTESTFACRSYGKYNLEWQRQYVAETADAQTTVVIEVNDFPSPIDGRVGRPTLAFYVGTVVTLGLYDFELKATKY